MATKPRRKTAQAALALPSAQAMQAWLSVGEAYNLWDAVMTRRLAGLGLRVAEHEVLVNLLRAPGITQQALAQRCFVAKSGASMMLTRLEMQRLVERQADSVDARVRRLFLTPEGRALADKAQAVQMDVVSALVKGSSPGDLKFITAAMQRASALLANMLGAAAPRDKADA